MFELSQSNVVDYLLDRGEISSADVLIQQLGGGVSSVVIKVMDANGGEPVGTDMRTPGQIKRGVPDTRMRAGKCMVLKQPKEHFAVATTWRVDTDRIWLERDALGMLSTVMPAGTLPAVMWADTANQILAISPAPPEYVNFKNLLLAGKIFRWPITAAARWLAQLHMATAGMATPELFNNQRLFQQQRIVPYLKYPQAAHPVVADRLELLGEFLLSQPVCLIHGDFSPKNILIASDAVTERGIFVVDFEVVFRGQPLFDITTLMNHLLLKGFYHAPQWRPFMLLADEAWHAYQQAATPRLLAAAGQWGGILLGGLLLARVDGQSPVEYLTDELKRQAVRDCAVALLKSGGSMDDALDAVGEHLGQLG